MTLTFAVTQAQDGMFLRDFLHRNQVSMKLAKDIKYIGNGFFADGMPILANMRVRAGMQISFTLPPEKETLVEPQDLPLNIVYEDDHAMVLDKPAGQTVHPTRGYVYDTLGNAYCGLLQQRGIAAPFRPVNRLDRNTSGLVLCAMHQYAAPLLGKSVQKKYYAIVQGKLPLGEGFIDLPIGLAPDSIMQRSIRPDGKPSQTQYDVLCANDTYSLVKCTLLTGRTHQIRVHFSALGYPLAGDDLYGGAQTEINRQALHCGEIAFADPITGQLRSFTSDLPQDMQALVEKIQQD